ncbi:hypothetical protein [Treponema parvum]|nr:hypothetical protein [Treponema parvum]
MTEGILRGVLSGTEGFGSCMQTDPTPQAAFDIFLPVYAPLRL